MLWDRDTSMHVDQPNNLQKHTQQTLVQVYG